jgi:hypothetical protein
MRTRQNVWREGVTLVCSVTVSTVWMPKQVEEGKGNAKSNPKTTAHKVRNLYK